MSATGTIDENGIVNVDGVDPELLRQAILEAPSVLFKSGNDYYVRIGTATAPDADEQYPILRNQSSGQLFLVKRGEWDPIP